MLLDCLSLSSPAPVRLNAGEVSRLRSINITPSNNQRIRLLADSITPTRWRLFAKDRAEVTPAQAVEMNADVRIGAGETYDFTFLRREPGQFSLVVTTAIRRKPAREMRIPVVVE